jgi:hypothetical protein
MSFSNLYADAYNLLDESYRNLTIESEETSCLGRYSPVSPVVPPIDPLQSSPIYAPVENLVATEIESVSDDETSALTVNELVYELVSNNKNGLDILIDGFVMSKLRDNKNYTNYKCRHKTGREACPGSVTVDRGSGKVLRYVEHERHDRLS